MQFFVLIEKKQEEMFFILGFNASRRNFQIRVKGKPGGIKERCVYVKERDGERERERERGWREREREKERERGVEREGGGERKRE